MVQNNKDISRNKGEWSESYILLKLIHTKEIPFGDAKLQPLEDKINLIALATLTDKVSIKIISSNEIQIIDIKSQNIIKNLNVNDILCERDLDNILSSINKGEGAFSEPGILMDRIFAKLGMENKKAPGDSKVDLYLSFSHLGQSYNQQPIGLKSYLGAKPTLVNPTKATMFQYELIGIKSDIASINNQTEGLKCKSFIQKIISLGGEFKFKKVKNSVYETNLIKVDSLMPNLIAKILLQFFSSKGTAKISELIHDEIEKIHVKRFLLESLLGILPGSDWDGKRIANGSIELNKKNNLLFYHVVKQDLFEDFLFFNTKLDSPQIRNQTPYCFLYEEDKKICIDLCLQVRFS